MPQLAVARLYLIQKHMALVFVASAASGLLFNQWQGIITLSFIVEKQRLGQIAGNESPSSKNHSRRRHTGAVEDRCCRSAALVLKWTLQFTLLT